MSQPIASPPVAATRAKCPHHWRALALTLGLVLLLLAAGGAWWLRRPLLTGLADLWIISDPPAAADAVAVLGGGLDTRPFAAAEYYKEGLVRRVLISRPRLSPVGRLGLLPSDAAATRMILLKLGVPSEAIEEFGHDVASTRDEALALRDWAAAHAARNLIVPTEIFSTRRVRWMLHRSLGDNVGLRVPGLAPLYYRDDNWWQYEYGVIAFQNEVVKYLYYRLRY